MKEVKSLPDPFMAPIDPNIKIWRYMDFAKFVSMLEKNGLFFVRASELEDVFEGSTTKRNLIYRDAYIDFLEKNTDLTLEDAKLIVQEAAHTNYERRYWIMICSWHMSKNESAAMWKIYSEYGKGICIQTTFKSLRDCLPPSVHIGLIKYRDYSRDFIPEGNIFYRFLSKQNWYEFESELRAINWQIPKRKNVAGTHNKSTENDQWINVDLERLIEKVYVAPESEDWFEDVVRRVIKRYDLTVQVQKSSLNKKPIY